MEIIIPVNKKRFPVQLFICTLVAMVLCVYFYYTRSLTLNPYSPVTILVVLLIIVIRYIIVLGKEYLKLQFDRKANFTITETGVIDNITFVSMGKIPWEDIDDIALDRYRGMDILLIGITNPDKYSSGMRPIYRSVFNGYIKKWNTPLVISEKRVDYDLESLRDLLLIHSTSTINSHDLRNVSDPGL
ncbi:MAG: hypothetical protein M3N30_13815 [Bacteroidota bacterium]|nr:hypothetical protein [Bacteroidota bacterium]